MSGLVWSEGLSKNTFCESAPESECVPAACRHESEEWLMNSSRDDCYAWTWAIAGPRGPALASRVKSRRLDLTLLSASLKMRANKVLPTGLRRVKVSALATDVCVHRLEVCLIQPAAWTLCVRADFHCLRVSAVDSLTLPSHFFNSIQRLTEVTTALPVKRFAAVLSGGFSASCRCSCRWIQRRASLHAARLALGEISK